MIDKDKIKELLRGDNADKTLAVSMMRMKCNLSETVDIFADVTITSRQSVPIVLSIYNLPYSMRRGGTCNLNWQNIIDWAAKSPYKRPSRDKFAKETIRKTLVEFFGINRAGNVNASIDFWNILGLSDD